MVAFGIRRLQGPHTFGGILLFGLLAMTARNAVDPDLWWHLRTGQWIAETGHVPLSDPFSFTRAGHTWVSHEWLSEVTFYELWKHGGAAALIVFCALVTTAGFMLLYFRCPGKKHWAAAMTAIGALDGCFLRRKPRTRDERFGLGALVPRCSRRDRLPSYCGR